MAKFCTKCGKPLTEGEVCSCMNNANDGQSNNENIGMDANVVLENTKNIALDIWKLMLNVIKKPFTTAKEYVTSNDNMMAFILIALQGIFTGILVLTLISRLFGEILGGLKNIASSSIDVNPFGNFIVGLLVSVTLSFVYALILYGLAMMFKVNINYMTCVRAMAVRAIAMTLATILTIIIGLMSAKIGIVVGLIIVPIIGFIFNLAAIKSLIVIDENRFAYFVLIFILISLIAYYIIAIKIGFANIPLVRSAKNGLNNISSLLNGFKSSSSAMSGLFN